MPLLETKNNQSKSKSKKVPTPTVKIVFDLPAGMLTTETLSVASHSNIVELADILTKFHGIDKREIIDDLECKDVITIAAAHVPSYNGAVEELMLTASEFVRFFNICYQPVSFKLEKRRLENHIFKLLVKDINTGTILECSDGTIMRLAGFNHCDFKCEHSRAINLNGVEYYPVPGGHGECLRVVRVDSELELLSTPVKAVCGPEGYSIETAMSKTTFKPMDVFIDNWYQFTYIAS